MKIHKYAKLMPPMSPDAFASLRGDIQEHGLLVPITMLDGSILDGVNRYRACQELGIEPAYVDYKGNGALSFVISQNLMRRHLGDDQRAMLVVELKEQLQEEIAAEKEATRDPETGQYQVSDSGKLGEGPWHERAASLAGTSKTRVSEADRIKRVKPERVKDVLAGEVTIADVTKEIKQDVKNEEAKLKAERKESGKSPLDWKNSAVAKEIINWIKTLRSKFIPVWRASAELKSLSPESRWYVANRLMEAANEMLELAQELRADHPSGGKSE